MFRARGEPTPSLGNVRNHVSDDFGVGMVVWYIWIVIIRVEFAGCDMTQPQFCTGGKLRQVSYFWTKTFSKQAIGQQ
jgi:hypothetical protein